MPVLINNGQIYSLKEMNVENFVEVLEQELEDAVEIKNKKSLHRYILLLTDNVVRQDRFDRDVSEVKSEVRIIADSMRQGFAHMDKRFEDMNKRFDEASRITDKRFEDMNKRFDDTNVRFGDMNKRFSAMFTYMNIALSILVVITVLFKFL